MALKQNNYCGATMICCGRGMTPLRRKISIIEIIQADPFIKEDQFLDGERKKGKKIYIHSK
jgi:hypothetical protein